MDVFEELQKNLNKAAVLLSEALESKDRDPYVALAMAEKLLQGLDMCREYLIEIIERIKRERIRLN